MSEHIFKPNSGKKIAIVVQGEIYLRLPIQTRLIQENDNLAMLLQEYVVPHLKDGDLVFISEKIVAITQGRIIRIKDVKISWLARFLAKRVNNKVNTPDFMGYGHGTAPAMELFIQEAGYPRVIFAAFVSMVTRPFGIKGLFYLICGKNAKSIDCPMSYTLPPYTEYAKRAILNPMGVADKIKGQLGNDTIIIDANYLGVFSLGKSNNDIQEKFIQKLFRDNPAGQDGEMTPFFIIRKDISSSTSSVT